MRFVLDLHVQYPGEIMRPLPGALTHISLCRHVDVVSYLLQMGADPLVPDKVHSRTCLHYAAWNGELLRG